MKQRPILESKLEDYALGWKEGCEHCRAEAHHENMVKEEAAFKEGYRAAERNSNRYHWGLLFAVVALGAFTGHLVWALVATLFGV